MTTVRMAGKGLGNISWEAFNLLLKIKCRELKPKLE